MRHRIAGRKLGRNPSHRLALFRNLSMALIRHERIVTTTPKAKAVRPFVERLITLAVRAARAVEVTPENPEPDKALALHYRRLAISRLGTPGGAEVKPVGADENDETADVRSVIQKLFDELGPRFKERPGGYTRILKRHQRRLGDGGDTAYLELLKEGEVKVKAKQAAEAPAPAVEEEEEEKTEPQQEEAAAESKEEEPKQEEGAEGESRPAEGGDQPRPTA